jgi:hypothetical protein
VLENCFKQLSCLIAFRHWEIQAIDSWKISLDFQRITRRHAPKIENWKHSSALNVPTQGQQCPLYPWRNVQL